MAHFTFLPMQSVITSHHLLIINNNDYDHRLEAHVIKIDNKTIKHTQI